MFKVKTILNGKVVIMGRDLKLIMPFLGKKTNVIDLGIEGRAVSFIVESWSSEPVQVVLFNSESGRLKYCATIVSEMRKLRLSIKNFDSLWLSRDNGGIKYEIAVVIT